MYKRNKEKQEQAERVAAESRADGVKEEPEVITLEETTGPRDMSDREEKQQKDDRERGQHGQFAEKERRPRSSRSRSPTRRRDARRRRSP